MQDSGMDGYESEMSAREHLKNLKLDTKSETKSFSLLNTTERIAVIQKELDLHMKKSENSHRTPVSALGKHFAKLLGHH